MEAHILTENKHFKEIINELRNEYGITIKKI